MNIDSITDHLTARVMATANRDMEQEALDRLAPAATDSVLEVGFGPGVGIDLLVQRLTRGEIAGADPSAAMCRSARRRNRAAVAAGRVRLVQSPAHDLPFDDGLFDGVMAVNCAQLFAPLTSSLRELARVTRPHGRLVTLTHDWAIRRHSVSVDDWLEDFRHAAVGCGYANVEVWEGRARSGGTVGVAAIRAP